MVDTIITPNGIFAVDRHGNIMCSICIDTIEDVDFSKGIKVSGCDITYNDEKEIMNMERNKVLDLYVERRRKALREEYETNYTNEYNEIPVVKEYNELVATFEAALAELKSRPENVDKIRYCGYQNDYGYELDSSVKQEIKNKHYAILTEKMREVDDMANEVHALLSLSDDKDYQIEVLINYGILDKKTKQLTI